MQATQRAGCTCRLETPTSSRTISLRTITLRAKKVAAAPRSGRTSPTAASAPPLAEPPRSALASTSTATATATSALAFARALPSRPSRCHRSCHGLSTSKPRLNASTGARSQQWALLAAAEQPAAAAEPAAALPTGSPAAAAAASVVVDDFATDQRPVILFDGVCNLCNRGVNFMLDNDPGGAFRLAALQSPAGRRLLIRCGRSPDDISSIVLVQPDAHFIRSEAILRIGARLRIPLPLLSAFGFPVPLPLRDAFYDAVANNRYSFFGRTNACRLRDAGKFADRFLVS